MELKTWDMATFTIEVLLVNLCKNVTKQIILANKPTSHSSTTALFRFITFRNLSVSDEAIVDFLVVFDGVPITSFSMDDITLTGEGR